MSLDAVISDVIKHHIWHLGIFPTKAMPIQLEFEPTRQSGQKSPKEMFSSVCDLENRNRNRMHSIQSDQTIEPKCCPNLKKCLIEECIIPRINHHIAGPTVPVAMICESNHHQFTHNPCAPDGMPCEPLRIDIIVLFVAKSCTRCKSRTTRVSRSISIHFSLLVRIQLLVYKLSSKKWIINLEFATENNSSTWRKLWMKIPPMDSDFIQIQIWQP
jgi:hypothetical protein